MDVGFFRCFCSGSEHVVWGAPEISSSSDCESNSDVPRSLTLQVRDKGDGQSWGSWILGGGRTIGKQKKAARAVGVSKNRGGTPPKWMVKIVETPKKNHDLGENTTIFRNTHVS